MTTGRWCAALGASLVWGLAAAALAAGSSGVLTSVDPGAKRFTLSDGDAEVSFLLSEKGTVVRGRETLSIGDLHSGQWVEVSYSLDDGERVANRVELLEPDDEQAPPSDETSDPSPED